MELSTDPIWYNKISILLEKPTEIFPLNYSKMITTEQKINSMVRFAILTIIGAFLLGRCMVMKVLVLALIFVIGSVFYFERQKSPPVITTESFSMSRPFANMIPPRYIQPEMEQSRGLQTSIIDDIKGTMRFDEQKNKEMNFFNNQLSREQNHFNLLMGNRTTNGELFTSPPHTSHLRKINSAYGY